MLTLALLGLLAGAPPAPAPSKPAGSWCHVYPKRCEPDCKKAHADAMKGACGKPSLAFNLALKDKAQARALGQCLIACKKPGDAEGCVGAADEAACGCQEACYQQLPREVVDAAKAAALCYQQAVEPACH